MSNYITKEELTSTLNTFGDALANQLAGQLNEAQGKEEKKISATKALKKEFNAAKTAIIEKADEALKQLKEEYKPKFEEISDDSTEEFQAGFESAGEAVGELVGEVAKPVARFFSGLKKKIV